MEHGRRRPAEAEGLGQAGGLLRRQNLLGQVGGAAGLQGQGQQDPRAVVDAVAVAAPQRTGRTAGAQERQPVPAAAPQPHRW